MANLQTTLYHLATEREHLAQLAGPCEETAGAAFTLLYERLTLPTLRYARTLGDRIDVPDDLCADATHDVWGTVWSQRTRALQPPLQAYLFTAVRNCIFNMAERFRVEERRAGEFYIQYEYPLAYDHVVHVVHSAPSADIPVLQAELRKCFVHCVRSMHPGRRRVIVDYLCHGLTVTETAERLGMAKSTVKNHRGDGMRQLVAALAEAGYDCWP